MEFNEGLHWQEERDLCRALYASLQPSRDRCGLFDLSENGDSEVTDSGDMNSCLEEDSMESSTFQQTSVSGFIEMESESTDQEKRYRAEVPFNHVPRIMRQEMKRQKGRRKKKHKHKKEREKRTPSLKLALFEDEELKNKKIHAQRKFAVSYSPSASPNKPTPLSAPILKAKLGKLSPGGGDPDSIFNCSPKTEDFLTFLCLRGTSVLPGRMNLVKKSQQRSLKLHRKECAAEKDVNRIKNGHHAVEQAQPLQKRKDRSLLQKEKAKAVRTLNHKKRSKQRPLRECKQPFKICNKMELPKELAASEIHNGPLTPPCLSPIPPPIVTVAEHHNPPPLLPIMPLDGSKKGHKEQRVKREHKNGPTEVTKLRKRQKATLRTTSYQSAQSTNAAVESRQVLLKRKLRSSKAEGGRNEEAETAIPKKRRVKVQLDVNEILKNRNNNHVRPARDKKARRTGRLNGSLAHGPVTRANVSSKDGEAVRVALNGIRGRRKKDKDRLKMPTAATATAGREGKKVTTTTTGGGKEGKKKDTNEVTPRRSTRKRILRFDVQCVYSGLLSSSNAIIQSTDCTCHCCKIEERKPRKRKTKVRVKKSQSRYLRNLDGVNGSPGAKGEGTRVKAEDGAGKPTRREPQRQPKQPPNLDDSLDEGKSRSNRVSMHEEEENAIVVEEKREKPSVVDALQAIPDKRSLKLGRQHIRLLKAKNDGIYRNGEVTHKKLRNGTNLSLEPFTTVATSKFISKDNASPVKNAISGSLSTSEKKRAHQNRTQRKKGMHQPLRTKLERQFSCATKTSAPLSLKAKSRLSAPPLVGNKPKCGIPITLPRLASNSLIRDIEQSSHLSTNASGNLTEVPTFQPTAQDWSNLTLFLEKHAKTIEKFGMCKIKPPPGYEPSGAFPDSLRITPEVQYVHRLHHRWSSSSKRLACLKRHLEKKEKVAFQPPQIFGCEVDLLRFSELIALEGGFKAVRAKKKWPKLADQLNIPRNVSRRTNKLESICLKYLVSFSSLSQAEKNDLMKEVEVERQHRLDEAGRTNPFGVTESEARRGSHQVSLSQFKQRADLIEQIIRAGEDNTPSDVEREFWKIVEESDSYVAVQRAEIQGCNSERFASTLCNLHENGSNILSVLPTATKQKLPTLKVGTVYSVEPWRASSHGLGKLEYLHSGNHKIWYSIPKYQAAQLERVLQEHATETKGKSCLYDKSFIFMVRVLRLSKEEEEGCSNAKSSAAGLITSSKDGLTK
ncbi:hypothetical protein BSL78_19457 [Apostichopus japonicus]|uniref:ARID domain-containing protein n=1 Tax=Stichopus japonicus TaxID=307972 RepID=A0A2G8K6W1_STIJA|nr:hypothetical protein BSL78_19457 [Apostichopus japonicus]